MKKRGIRKTFSIMMAALVVLTGMSTTTTALASDGTYTVIYQVDPAYSHYYNLKNNNAQTYTQVKAAGHKITSFGVWLRAKGQTSGKGDMDVMMTLLNDVSGTKDKKEIHFFAGQVISKRQNNQAFVDYGTGIGFTNFSHGTVIRIKVSPYNPPAEAELYSVEFKTHGNGVFEGRTLFEKIPFGTTFAEAVPVASRPNPMPDPGYEFKGWDVKGIPEEDSKVEGDLHIYAEFEEMTAEIRYAVSSNKAGSVSLEKESLKAVNGAPRGVKAQAKEDYSFVNWTDEEGNVVSQDETLIPAKNTEHVYVNQVYTANFKANEKEESAGAREKTQLPPINSQTPPPAVAVTNAAAQTTGTQLTAAAPETREAQTRSENGRSSATIEENQIPLADGAEKQTGGWALVNLIMAIAALSLSGVFLAVRSSSKGFIKAGSVALAAASVILLLLTQNFKLDMAMTDSWTIPMILLAGIEIVLLILTVKAEE